MLSKEVSVETCLNITVIFCFYHSLCNYELAKLIMIVTLDAEIWTECRLPGARLRCRALKEGNSVGWPRYTCEGGTWVFTPKKIRWPKYKCKLQVYLPHQNQSQLRAETHGSSGG